MAIFGFQLTFTLIVFSFLHKLTPIYSLGRWLLCNGSLARYKHPSDDELRKLSGKQKEISKAKNKKNLIKNEKTFKVAKNIELVLETESIGIIDSLVLKNYADYQWLVDYCLYGTIVYTGTEVYYWFCKPESEFNISLVWLALLTWFAMKNLLSVLWLYAKSQAGGELSVSVAFAMLSFILSLAVMMWTNEVLDLKFANMNIDETNSMSINIPRLQLLLAVLSGVIGMLYIFPAIRMAQMYMDALKYCEGKVLHQFALHFNFFSPALVSLTWVKPLLNSAVKDPRTGQVVIQQHQIEIFRIYLVIFICIVRILLFRIHLQAYLNLAYEKFKLLKRESGMILNIDLQRLISQIYLYLGVVAVQYLSPLVMLLCSSLFLKTLSGYSWFAIQHSFHYQSPNTTVSLNSTISVGDSLIREFAEIFQKNINDFQLLLPLKEILPYYVWWSATSWFIATCVGYFYQTYLVM